MPILVPDLPRWGWWWDVGFNSVERKGLVLMREFTAIVGVLALTWASVASADSVLLTLNFQHIVEAGDGQAQIDNGAIGASQFKVDVVELTGLQHYVQFTVRNTAGQAGFIDGIYFDDGTLLGISDIVDGPGVDFAPSASPPVLSGGATLTPPFVVTAGFSADANSGAANGIDPGEYTNLIFQLQGTQTAQSVVDALFLDPSLVGSLRIGLKGQGFPNDTGGEDSESFVNVPPVVPLPPAAWGGVAMFGVLAAGKLRRLLGA